MYLPTYKRPNYGKLPDKVAREIPWNKLFVYLIDCMGFMKIPMYVILKSKRKNEHLKPLHQCNKILNVQYQPQTYLGVRDSKKRYDQRTIIYGS